MINRKLYEEFHKNSKSLLKVPKETDFGMIHHLPIFKKYFKSGKVILDIGCGSGPMSLYAASKGSIVKGIDLSEKVITENNKSLKLLKIDNLEFKQENFLEYNDNDKYDVVILMEVLEHLPDDYQALLKIKSLLKQDGHLLLSVPSKNAPLHLKNIKKFKKDEFDDRVGHLRRYNVVDIFNLLHQAGYRLIEFKLCEGYLRNWLYNDKIGNKFMIFNLGPIKKIVTFLDNTLFTPIFGESDIIIVAQAVGNGRPGGGSG